MAIQTDTDSVITHPLSAANARIEQIAPYQPGKPMDELQRELGMDDIVKLASNENPFGCSPYAQAAAQQALADIARYPDGNGFVLKQSICQHYGVSSEHIVLGNGSNDILELAARTFVSQSHSVIFSEHGFAIYALVTQALGALGVAVAARDYGHDLSAMADAIDVQTKLIFIANPNNPTGTWFANTEFEQFMQRVPKHIIVVLDEAYVEYAPDIFDSLPLLKRYDNLIISRTFSKAYGLAALRVGFALTSAPIASLMNRVRQPFNVNGIALAAATAALADHAFIVHCREQNQQGMQQIEQGLRDLGLNWIPSKANFICIHLPRLGRDVFQALLHQGVIVRPVDNYGLPQAIRVTIGSHAENIRFLNALRSVLFEAAR